MVSLVETMPITADGLQLAAYGPDEDEIRFIGTCPRPKRRTCGLTHSRLTACGLRATRDS